MEGVEVIRGKNGLRESYFRVRWMMTWYQGAGALVTRVVIAQHYNPVSIQTQSLALRALRKRQPQETQAPTLASSQSWLPLLRPSIPIGWRLRLLRENFTQASANRNARSKQWQPWLAACQRKRLRFLRFSFKQRTQRKRLRLNGNRASVIL